MPLVVDASVALAWLFEDERPEYAVRILQRLRSEIAVVPSLWPAEIANGLLFAERRGRLSQAKVSAAVAATLDLEIEVESNSPEAALRTLLDLAREEKLTVYDSAYLELAMRRSLPLASLDADLMAAASRVGVELVT